jgi:hypothetical protein
MYNRNTKQGKEQRVYQIMELVKKISAIPGDLLSYGDAGAVNHYLLDIQADLQAQLKKEYAKTI